MRRGFWLLYGVMYWVWMKTVTMTVLVIIIRQRVVRLTPHRVLNFVLLSFYPFPFIFKGNFAWCHNLKNNYSWNFTTKSEFEVIIYCSSFVVLLFLPNFIMYFLLWKIITLVHIYENSPTVVRKEGIY